jgi:hypothetical protein
MLQEPPPGVCIYPKIEVGSSALGSPQLFPGDPAPAAAPIYQVVKSHQSQHSVLLGSDAHRLVGQKLDQLRAGLETANEITFRTDFPDAVPAVL